MQQLQQQQRALDMLEGAYTVQTYSELFLINASEGWWGASVQTFCAWQLLFSLTSCVRVCSKIATSHHNQPTEQSSAYEK